MPSSYTVDANKADPSPMIDDAGPVMKRGPALMLHQADVLGGAWFTGAGKSETAAFANQRSVGTRGLGHCIGLCVVWNKTGDTFADGYCAHMSSVQGEKFKLRMAEIEAKGGLQDAWAAFSIGSAGGWAQTLTDALIKLGIPDDHIWVYQRAAGSNTFGVDRHGNFGEDPG
jgi:hypothetical protein